MMGRKPPSMLNRRLMRNGRDLLEPVESLQYIWLRCRWRIRIVYMFQEFSKTDQRGCCKGKDPLLKQINN